MPELLPEGLPERPSRSRYDFGQWADGQAWSFTRGKDYTSSTDTFRYNVKRWAKANGYEVETRPVPATDQRGRPIPVAKADPVGLAVRFTAAAPRVQEARSDTSRSREVETRAA